MGKRAALVLLFLPGSARANGAMGLGLEIFELESWFAYVIAMVFLEAWWLGRNLGLGVWKSLLVSMAANLVTGMCCSVINPLAALFHSPIGPQGDQNPVLHSFVVLTGCAFPSALVEGAFWARMVARDRIGAVYRLSLLVHLVTVPLALGILLIPERPYKGLEGFVSGSRWGQVYPVKRALEDYVAEHQRLPTFTGSADFLSALKLEAHDLAFYEASYRRFSTRDERDQPWIWNTADSGLPLKEGEKERWVMIAHRPGRPDLGLFVDLSWGQVQMGSRPR